MSFLTIFAVIFGFSLLIVVHEAGHYFAAKWTGVRVEKAALGLPPKVFSFFWRGTEYALNLLPFGGYVQLKGMVDDLAQNTTDLDTVSADSYQTKKVWQKLLILLGGVLMNAVTAFVIFALTIASQGTTIAPSDVSRVVVLDVVSGGIADQFGIGRSAELVSLNGVSLLTAESFLKQSAERKPYLLGVRHQYGSFVQMYAVNPALSPQWKVGLYLANVSAPRDYSIFESIRAAWRDMSFLSDMFVRNMQSLGTHLFVHRDVTVMQDVSGPVGIVQMLYTSAQQSFWETFRFLGTLSLSLALFNVLPLPVLDGGHAVITLLESVFRRRLPIRLLLLLQNIGILFFLLLFLSVTYFDVSRLIS